MKLLTTPFSVPSVLWRCWLGSRKGIRPVKNGGGWSRWALVTLDGVAPTQTSVNLPLHHKVQKFSSGTGSPGWSRKKGRKMVVVTTPFSQTQQSHSPFFSILSVWYKHSFQCSSSRLHFLRQVFYITIFSCILLSVCHHDQVICKDGNCPGHSR